MVHCRKSRGWRNDSQLTLSTEAELCLSVRGSVDKIQRRSRVSVGMGGRSCQCRINERGGNPEPRFSSEILRRRFRCSREAEDVTFLLTLTLSVWMYANTTRIDKRVSVWRNRDTDSKACRRIFPIEVYEPLKLPALTLKKVSNLN